MMAVMMMPLVEPPTPMATMMAVAGILDRRAGIAGGRQLAKNVAGCRSSLGATNGHDARKCAGDGSEGEESSHVSSFFCFQCATASIFAVQRRTTLGSS
jgi:hypothetical protein